MTAKKTAKQTALAREGFAVTADAPEVLIPPVGASAEPEPPEPEPDEDDVLPEYVDIPFRGYTFVVPRSRDDWSTEGLAYLGEGAFHLFVKYNLELARPGQWEQLVRLAPTRRGRNEFFEVHNKIVTEECVD